MIDYSCTTLPMPGIDCAMAELPCGVGTAGTAPARGTATALQLVGGTVSLAGLAPPATRPDPLKTQPARCTMAESYPRIPKFCHRPVYEENPPIKQSSFKQWDRKLRGDSSHENRTL
jgi:hypothetical protein